MKINVCGQPAEQMSQFRQFVIRRQIDIVKSKSRIEMAKQEETVTGKLNVELKKRIMKFRVQHYMQQDVDNDAITQAKN